MEKWVSGTPGVWNSGVIPPRRKAEGPRGDGITHSGLTPSGTWGSRHQEPGGSRHQKPGAYATGLYDVAPLGAGGGSWSAAFVVKPGARATGLYDVAPIGAGGGSWSVAFVVKPGARATGLCDVAPLGAGGGSWSAAFVVPPLVGIPL